MMLTELESDNLEEIVSNEETVVVQYSAGWCGNCRIMKPKFKKLARENEDAKFIIVDAEKNPASRKMANVDNLPTFAAFKNGKIVNQVQTNKFDVLKDLVHEVTAN
jgi:thiol-disulfide isomerase/thioredoxin